MISKALTGTSIFLALIFVTISVVSLSRFPVADYITILATPTVDCAPIVETYKHNVLKPKLIEIIDSVELMSNTPRIALPGQLSDFQKVRRDIAANVPNGCAMDLHNRLVKALNNVDAGFMAFIAKDDEIDVSLPLKLAVDELSALSSEIE